jgi:hypothetical protein
MSMDRHIINHAARSDATYPGLFDVAEYERVEAFFNARPEIRQTPLHESRGLASALNVGGLACALVSWLCHRNGALPLRRAPAPELGLSIFR